MAPGQDAHAEVVAAFGPEILAADGSIDRRILGPRVFADPAARARLDAIVHPRVRAAEARLMSEGGTARVAVTDAALLVESGMHLRFDRLVVVHCDPGTQVARLMARDGLDEEAARSRLRAQMPAADKRRFAHLEIDSSGALEQTDARADAVAAELSRVAAVDPPPAASLEGALAAIATGRADGPRGL